MTIETPEPSATTGEEAAPKRRPVVRPRHPLTHIGKLLVANRGEIALRVIRTAREMGIATVAVYSESDRDAPFASAADEAYRLPGDTYAETYFNQSLIIDVARRCGADAVHPGYGFLSEVPDFARAVIDAGLVWVGPDPEVLVDLGDKITARRFAERADVPPVPGISEPVTDIATLLRFSHEYGYPVMLKRTDGGGGHGITVVRDDDGLRSFFMSHDALQGGDLGRYFIEKFVAKSRHVETQCGRDSHGNFTVYSTRDCSVQRRNQKLIEEAPAPFLTEKENARLVTYSRRLFEAAKYVGLGTCEFMLTPTADVYFLEVNPRLQVEHTVSEEVSGIDLVREQLTIADGGTLTQAPAPRGHSFELRITSEDPERNLTPGAGTISALRLPSGPGVRVDFGVTEGSVISPKFDSMMGKIIVTAQDRDAAIARVLRALGEFSLEGVPTPCALFDTIFRDPDFVGDGTDFAVTTKWLEGKYLVKKPASSKAGQPASLTEGLDTAPTEVEPTRESFVFEVNDKRVEVTIPEEFIGALGAKGRAQRSRVQPLRGAGIQVREQRANGGGLHDGNICSPMQAVVTRVNVAAGQEVDKGDLLVVLESMKMENYVYAPAKGTVTDILVGPSDGVEAGDPLVSFDVAGAADTAAKKKQPKTAKEEGK